MKYIFVLFFLAVPFLGHASDAERTYKAVVTEVVSSEIRTLPGLGMTTPHQTIEVQFLNGDMKGKSVLIENDYVQLQKGDTAYILQVVRSEDGKELYSVRDPYRIDILIYLTVAFLILVIIFGGMQGVRGIVSLLGSLVLIGYVLLPGILKGFSPILLTTGVSSLIIIVGSYITHGFNRTTSAAVISMIVTVIFTGALATVMVDVTQLTGFESDESVYLNQATSGKIDFTGLLLGGIMIGLLGVLYDVAIGQAISVEELYTINPKASKRYVYARVLRMGREHIGALINTLAIAYVGVSLPLLLLFSTSTLDPLVVINKEIFSAEIVRTLVGSIGLVLAVPITTLISVFMVRANPKHSQENHHHHHGII
ncbi:MAG: YibE/F family protein [Candidatus Pacebacteria bacterium]|jgi:uncharacterized membrane protein|nr:YibE/F family protein [Candidatus Paceibacterota bacterium]